MSVISTINANLFTVNFVKSSAVHCWQHYVAMATVNMISCFLWSRGTPAWLHQPFSFTAVLHYAWAPNGISLRLMSLSAAPLHLVSQYRFSNRFTCLGLRNGENYVLLLLDEPLMPQAVSSRCLIWESRFRWRAKSFWTSGGHSGTVAGFSPVIAGFPLSVSFHLCSLLRLHSSNTDAVYSIHAAQSFLRS